MSPQELFLEHYSEKIMYLPVTNQFIDVIKKTVTELNIEVLSEDRITDLLFLFKLKLPKGEHDLFTLGAFVQINRSVDSENQKLIDEAFKYQLQ